MPPKRHSARSFSARPRKKVKLDHSDHENDSSDDESGSEPESDVQNCVARRVSKRRRRGSLKPLLKMSVEIMLEVLRHLTPLDLLRLSRISKAFRALLMARSSQNLWKTVWTNVDGLPPCPDDISEPAFVDLLYENWCHRCFRSIPEAEREMQWYWVCRARYCLFHGCQQTILKHQYCWDDIEHGFNPQGLALDRVVPSLKIQSEYWSSTSSTSIRLQDITEFMNVWKSVPKLSRIDFLEERKRSMQQLIEHADICSQWHKEKLDKDKQELELLRFQRYTKIIAELGNFGWAPVLQKMSTSQEKLFKETIELPYGGCFKSLRPEFTDLLKEIKQEQDATARVFAIQKRLHLLYDALLPTGADYSTHPSLRDIAICMPEAQKVIDAPPDATVSFENLMAALPKFIEYWRKKVHDRFADLVRQSRYVECPPGADPLALAIGSMFKCCKCCKMIPVTHVAAHYCMPLYDHSRRSTLAISLKKPVAYRKIVHYYLKDLPSILSPRQYEDQTEVLRYVISKSGYDYQTTTVEEMDSSDTRLVCLPCSKDGERTVMTWRAAVEHWGHVWPKMQCGYEKASEAEVKAAKKHEEIYVREYAYMQGVQCAHCPLEDRHLVHYEETFAEHLLSSHNIREPRDTDGFPSKATMRLCETPISLTPEEVKCASDEMNSSQ